MFQKFFTDTVESRFIKLLLRSTPIPLYPTVSDGDFVISNGIYINKYGVVKYETSGLAKDCSFTRLCPYIYGLYDKSFTEKYISKKNYYDSDTHEKLGNYLRVYRDLKDIDLMPFYNCFSYKFIDNIYLTKSSSNGYKLENNSIYKIASIPIKFDKTYSICLDSLTPIYFKSVLKDKFGLLTSKHGGEVINITDLLNYCKVYINEEELTNESCTILDSSNYGDVIHFKISLQNVSNSIALKLKSLEKYLYLLIQLSSDNDSAITIIEGNYLNKDKSYSVYNIETGYNILDDNQIIENVTKDSISDNIVLRNSNYTISNIFDSESTDSFDVFLNSFDKSTLSSKNSFLLNKVSLMELGCVETFAFSNKLIEYLLLNVIDSEDTIDNNITTVQNLLKLNNRLDTIPSVWSNRMRCELYKKYLKADFPLPYGVDVNGFVDKDVENILIRIGRGEF